MAGYQEPDLQFAHGRCAQRLGLEPVGITQGSPVRYTGIESLQQLDFLSVDLPGVTAEYVSHLPRLRELRFTAARRLTTVPLRTGQPVEQVMVHQSPSLDIAFVEVIADTLTELELDGVKSIVNSEALRSCQAMRTVVLENCGPSVPVDDLLFLMHEAALTKVMIIGSAVPFSARDAARLVNEAPPTAQVSVPTL